METSAEIGKIAGALAKAQARIEAVERDRRVQVTSKKGEESSYSFVYATFGACMDAIRGPLSENGIAVLQAADSNGDGVVTVTTRLAHESGEWIQAGISIRPPEAGPQALGSAITYLRRYGLSSLVGLVSEEDDDGNAAEGNAATFKPTPKCPKCAKPVRLSNDADGSYYCWAKRGGCGWSGFVEEPKAEPENKQDRLARAKAAQESVTGGPPAETIPVVPRDVPAVDRMVVVARLKQLAKLANRATLDEWANVTDLSGLAEASRAFLTRAWEERRAQVAGAGGAA